MLQKIVPFSERIKVAHTSFPVFERSPIGRVLQSQGRPLIDGSQVQSLCQESIVRFPDFQMNIKILDRYYDSGVLLWATKESGEIIGHIGFSIEGEHSIPFHSIDGDLFLK